MMKMSLAISKDSFSEMHSRPNGENLESVSTFYCKVNDRNLEMGEGRLKS